jgi:hypothetical protein
MTDSSTPFARGLSSELLAWLMSPEGRALIGAFAEHGLDVRLRGDYFNAYWANCSIAKVSWLPRRNRPLLRIHRKYLVDAPPLTAKGRGDYVGFDLSTTDGVAYRSSLPAILGAAEKHIGEEGRWEQRTIDSNLVGTPLLVIDRQVVNGKPRVELDMLAVATAADKPMLVAVELKRDLDNRIQHVAEQALKYVKMLDPDGTGLRADIATSYRTVCQQLRDLGLKACAPDLIQLRMPVVGLVALANYNSKSQLLDRALEAARRLDRPIRFCHLDGNHPRLPAPSEWFSEKPRV